MEEFSSFFTSMPGQVFSYTLLAVGATDCMLAYVLFGPRLAKAEEKRLFAANPKDLAVADALINGLKTIRGTLIGAGIAMIMVGIYGLSR